MDSSTIVWGRLRSVLITALIIVAAIGCDDEPTKPANEELAEPLRPSLTGCLGANGQVGMEALFPYVYNSAPLLGLQLGSVVDAQIAGTLSDLGQQFDVNFSARYFNDQSQANAFATSTDSEGSRDGTIRVGVYLVANEVNRFLRERYSPSNQYTYSVTAVLAHEIGHLLQFKRQNTSPGRNTELQADFLAGWYFSTLASRDPNYGPNAVQDGMRTFYEMGDYEFTSVFHHGTPSQRLAAFKAGMASNAKGLAAAWTAAVAYRQSIGG
jgi:hypothetical protein